MPTVVCKQRTPPLAKCERVRSGSVHNIEKSAGKTIPTAILFTRTSAAIRPRSLQAIGVKFASSGAEAREQAVAAIAADDLIRDGEGRSKISRRSDDFAVIRLFQRSVARA